MDFIFDRMAVNAAAGTLIEPQLKLPVDYQEAELGRSLWFAGTEFSGADIQKSGPMEAVMSRAGKCKSSSTQRIPRSRSCATCVPACADKGCFLIEREFLLVATIRSLLPDRYR
jgi:hypothetical protein